MSKVNRAIGLIPLVGLVVAGLVAPAAALGLTGGLDGLWVLVEESYGHGSRNLTADDNRVWIEFRGLRAETWFQDRSGSGQEWPAFLDAGGPVPVTPIAVLVDPAAGTADARYRVSQDPASGLQLEVHERYRVSEDGATLSGEVTVTFVQDGRAAGSFEMHRRFERAR